MAFLSIFSGQSCVLHSRNVKSFRGVCRQKTSKMRCTKKTRDTKDSKTRKQRVDEPKLFLFLHESEVKQKKFWKSSSWVLALTPLKTISPPHAVGNIIFRNGPSRADHLNRKQGNHTNVLFVLGKELECLPFLLWFPVFVRMHSLYLELIQTSSQTLTYGYTTSYRLWCESQWRKDYRR